VPSLGPLEILVIFIVALLVFGPNKLPELARQVGKGLAEFRRVQHHLRNELDDAIHSVMEDDKPQVASPVVTAEPVEVPPAVDVPGVDVPAVDAPEAEDAVVETPLAETPVAEPPVTETPVAEPPVTGPAPTEPGPTPPPLADDAS